MNIKRGDVFLANLEPVQGSEQGGIRPVLVIQNDTSNKSSSITIIAAITSRVYEKFFPTNVQLDKRDSNLKKDSTILLNQIRTISHSRLIKRLSTLDNFIMHQVDTALKISLAID